jgi:hypothetical protein
MGSLEGFLSGSAMVMGKTFDISPLFQDPGER